MIQGTIIGILVILYILAKIAHGFKQGVYAEGHGVLSLFVTGILYTLLRDTLIKDWELNQAIISFIIAYYVIAFAAKLSLFNLKYRADFSVTTSDSIFGALLGFVTGFINVFVALAAVYVWAYMDIAIREIVNIMSGSIIWYLFANNPVILILTN